MGGVPQRLTATMRLWLTDGETVQCPPPPPARLSLLRCPPAPQARVLVPASLASSRSATLGSSTTLAPPLDRVLPGALLLPLVQAPALMGSMDSARQPAHLTQPQQPPPPQPPQPQRPLQQQPQPPVPLLPQLQPRRPPAAPRAPSPRLQHLRLQLHRAIRLQHPHLLGHNQHNHDDNNHNHHHHHSGSFNMLSVLWTCSRTGLCVPLHIWRHHILRLC